MLSVCIRPKTKATVHVSILRLFVNGADVFSDLGELVRTYANP